MPTNEIKAQSPENTTLRSWLAGQALVGLCSSEANVKDPTTTAQKAVKLADAVVAELNKTVT